MKFIFRNVIIFSSFCLIFCSGCSLFVTPARTAEVYLPFLKNSANECYFLDEFMPVPDSMTTGKTGGLSLRYYIYNYANYKDWSEKHIILSFYSRDDRCWSLFEEAYQGDLVP